MAWSKKIILSLLIGLILVSCSSKRNYGISYFSTDQSFSDSSFIDEFSMRFFSLESDSIQKYLEVDGINLKVHESFTLDYNPDLIDTLVEARLYDEELSRPPLTFNDSLMVMVQNVDPNITDSVKEVKTIPESIAKNFIVDTVGFKSIQYVDPVIDFQDSISKIISIDSTRILSGSNKIIDSTLTFELDDILMDTNAPDSTVILDGENINLIPNSINNFGDSVINNPNYEEIESEMMTSLNPTFEDETTTSDSIQATDQHGQNNKTEVADSLNKSSLEIVDSEEIITDIFVDTTVSNEESIHSKAEIIDNIQVVTDTFIILQENPQYSSEIDSLKLLNEALRLRAKQSNSTVDTLVYSIFFSSGNQLLNYRNQETLADLVNDSQDKNYILQLSGHTDKSGSERQNKILSEKRVNNVLKYLVKNGLDERKIFIQSFGEKFSTNNNDLNQRVVLCRLIIKKEFETH